MAEAADPNRPLTPVELAVRTLLGLAARLPLWVFRGLGWVLGQSLYLLAVRRRHIALTNIELCFPDWSAERRRQTVQQHFVVLGQTLWDRIWLWHGPVAVLERRLRVVGDIQRLHEPGPRVVFVPHFEGLDVGGLWMSHLTQRDWYFLYVPQQYRALERWFYDGRTRFGLHPVPRVLGIKPVVKALREGGVLHFSPDMDLGRKDAVFVPFFAHPHTATLTSLGRLASLANAPVCGLVTQLTAQGYNITLTEDWASYPSGDDVADAREMNRRLESWIVQHPEQYHWTHRRFKSQPEGVSSPYQG
jgi:KDO2-lipid IV(A) lauroyltransferase